MDLEKIAITIPKWQEIPEKVQNKLQKYTLHTQRSKVSLGTRSGWYLGSNVESNHWWQNQQIVPCIEAQNTIQRNHLLTAASPAEQWACSVSGARPRQSARRQLGSERMQPAEEVHQQPAPPTDSLVTRSASERVSNLSRCLCAAWCLGGVRCEYKARRSPPLRSQTWEVAPNHMRVCLYFRLPLSPPRFAIRLLTWLKTSWGGGWGKKLFFYIPDASNSNWGNWMRIFSFT
jgi:hypothetical protein